MIVLKINDKPVGCLTSNSLAVTIQFIQTCKTTAKGAIKSLGTLHSYSIPFEAVYVKDLAVITYQDLTVLGRNREMIEWDLVDDEPGGIMEAGFAYIENLQLTGNVEDFIKFTGTLTGYGEIVDSPITYNVWYQDIDTPVDEGGNYVLVAP